MSETESGQSTSNTQASGNTQTPAPSVGASEAGLPTLGEKWYEKLPDDIRDEPSLRTIQDIAALSKSYVHAQKAIGADKVVLPSKHATEDDWKKFWTKVGHPEKIDDYKVDAPKDSGIDPDFLKGIKEQMYKSGVLPKSANDLVNWLATKNKELVGKSEEVRKQTLDKWEGSLKQEWGNAFDKNLAIAKNAIKHINDPELTKILDDTGFGSHPSVVKAFSKLGQLLTEDGIIQPVGGNQKTPKDAEREISSIMGNFEHPYHNSTHPGHKAAIEEMNELFSHLYPEPKGT